MAWTFLASLEQNMYQISHQYPKELTRLLLLWITIVVAAASIWGGCWG